MVVEVIYLCVRADRDFPEGSVLYCKMCFWVSFQPLLLKYKFQLAVVTVLC